MGEHEQSPTPSGEQSGPPAVRPPSEPVPVDPELRRQFEQFQQFQQFQEWQRQQGDRAQPPVPWGPPAPPARPPVWRRILRSWPVRKVVSLLVSVVVLLLGLYFAVDYLFGKEARDLPAHIEGGKSDTNRAQRRNQADDIVRQVYWKTAEPNPLVACVQFTDEAKQQFAENTAGLTGGAKTCEEAVAALYNLVTDRGAYSLTHVPHQEEGGSAAEISSCDLNVKGGPKLGWFKVEESPHLGQWQITEHRKETCPEGGSSTAPAG